MTRNLKTLGLALAVAFAMSTFWAAAASAKGSFTAEVPGSTIQATTEHQLSEEQEYFETIGRTIKCEVTHFHGTVEGKAPNLEVTPNFTDATEGSKCVWAGIYRITVTENACHFVFKNPETEPGQTDYAVEVDIACPAGQQLVLHIDNILLADACTLTVPSQTTQGKLTAVNNEGHINISGGYALKATMDSKNSMVCGVAAETSKELTINYVNNDPITFTAKASSIAVSD